MKILKKTFIPQTYSNSCWAAAIANSLGEKEFTVLKWVPHDTQSKMISNEVISNFPNLLMGKRGDFKTLSDCSWASIKQIIDNDCVLIYHFNIFGTNDSHFVNIYGYEENTVGQWLYIFDPKPDTKGSIYVLNYKRFRIISKEPNSIESGVWYFGNNVSNNTNLPYNIENNKDISISKLTKTEIKNFNQFLENVMYRDNTSDDFKLKTNLMDLIRGQTISLAIERSISQTEQVLLNGHFQIIRNQKFYMYFMPLVIKDSTKILKYISAIIYPPIDKSQDFIVDSILSLEFLNHVKIDENLRNYSAPNFTMTIYIENDNYRTLGIKISEIETLIPIDTKSFMAKPVTDLPQILDNKERYIKEMQQSIPKEIRNSGKF
ncbi:MAG: C39 family peptidase [Spirosomaceae bacterium]|jgi:hypothetical protein|nr:C39 family peptidase [Spirosomataceae bacterium]